MTEPNAPAFPNDNEDTVISMSGLTKREYFAAKALQSLLIHHNTYMGHPDNLARDSVLLADKLIDKLNNPNYAD